MQKREIKQSMEKATRVYYIHEENCQQTKFIQKNLAATLLPLAFSQLTHSLSSVWASLIPGM